MAVFAIKSPLFATPQFASRIDALDWTKGALVLCMIVYHAINYSAFNSMAFQFLAFLPPSFILIAGFLVGQVYVKNYDLDSWKPYRRLMVRGFKLLVLFAALNVAYCVARERNLSNGLLDFTNHSSAIFLSGNERAGIFEVLLPIAYFLLLAPALLWLRTRSGAAIIFCAGAVFIFCAALELNGISYKNLSLFSAGLLGMMFGLISINSINSVARHLPSILVIYATYRLCSFYFGEIYPVQMFGAVASLGLLYGIALHLDCTSTVGQQMTFFGKYTLLGYLAQIPLIQIIVHFAGGKPNQWLMVLATIITTAALLFLILRVIDELRRRIKFADTTYKTIFA